MTNSFPCSSGMFCITNEYRAKDGWISVSQDALNKIELGLLINGDQSSVVLIETTLHCI